MHAHISRMCDAALSSSSRGFGSSSAGLSLRPFPAQHLRGGDHTYQLLTLSAPVAASSRRGRWWRQRHRPHSRLHVQLLCSTPTARRSASATLQWLRTSCHQGDGPETGQSVSTVLGWLPVSQCDQGRWHLWQATAKGSGCRRCEILQSTRQRQRWPPSAAASRCQQTLLAAADWLRWAGLRQEAHGAFARQVPLHRSSARCLQEEAPH